MAGQEEKTKETRFRYIHHKNEKEVGIQFNQVQHSVHKLTLNTDSTDTIVLEKLTGGVITSLRILNINYRRITPGFFNEYASISRLEVGCLLSITWLFRQLPYLTRLKELRLGKQTFFRKEEEDPHLQSFRSNATVTYLEITYDQIQYDKLSESGQKNMDAKVVMVLKLAQSYFPGLQECTISVPKRIEEDLCNFLKHFPSIYKRGEKRSKFGNGPVSFICQSKTARKRQHNGINSGAENGRDSVLSPTYDAPDLVQRSLITPAPATNGMYKKMVKIEPEQCESDILILEPGGNEDCVYQASLSSPATSTASTSASDGSNRPAKPMISVTTNKITSSRTVREKSPSLLVQFTSGV